MPERMHTPASAPEDLTGRDLEDFVRDNEGLLQEAVEGFKQIEAGENSAFTLDEVRESLKNDRPII